MKAIHYFERSVPIHQQTWHYILEDLYDQNHSEKLKCHIKQAIELLITHLYNKYNQSFSYR